MSQNDKWEMSPDAKIYVAGHRGMVGRSLVRQLRAAGFDNQLLRTHSEVDLCSQAATEALFATERPDVVLMAAARVGGIWANATQPADFIGQNLKIAVNTIDAAYRHGCGKFLFFGSSCIYPRVTPQPIPESALLTGPLEPTNDAFALAKIASIKMCEAYAKQHGFNAVSLMSCSLYGPADNFDPESSHVVPALMLKAHHAKLMGATHITLWGSGTPRRELLHVDDLAAGAIHLARHHNDPAPINVGAGDDISIRDLATLICDVVGFEGELRYDASRPDGTPQKVMDTGRVRATGWAPTIALREGLSRTYAWFLEHEAHRYPPDAGQRQAS